MHVVWYLCCTKNDGGVFSMSSGGQQSEGRSCSVVWWYGSKCSCMISRIAAGWVARVGVLCFGLWALLGSESLPPFIF